MREFETGATRDTEEGKIDFEGFLSPLALRAFGQYMHKHRTQSDGKLRDSDNWQKGIPKDAYLKSAWRHFFNVWELSRGVDVDGVTLVDALCATMFNIQGLLHETLNDSSTPSTKLKSIARAKTDMGAEAKRPRKSLLGPGESMDGPFYYEQYR